MKKIFILCVVIQSLCFSQEQTHWRVEVGALVSHFQQQIKRAVGDPRGQRLVNEFQLGGLLSGIYRVQEFIHAGMFVRIDRGERFLANFSGFDSDGKTQTKDGIGGTYTELWIGPLIQLQWKQLTLDLGYAAYGARSDNARSDIMNINNSIGGSFSLHPKIAWLFSVGGSFTIFENIDLLMKIEYRPRYYSERGGSSLINNIEHGTQSIVPILGVAFLF